MNENMRHLLLWIGFAATALLQGQDFKLVRSQSGPSGKVVGSKLVIEDIRNRFVFPNDKNLVVYFEWEGPIGDHVLTGHWKNPQGAIAEISPEVRLQTTARDFACYWQYTLRAGMPSGVWTLEIRIDGRPAGAHPFEVVAPELPKEPVPPAPKPEPPTALTTEEIYRRVLPSLVWIHKLDSAGRRVDTSSGFVFGPGRVATAFQSVDAANQLQVAFSDGRTVTSDRIAAFHRLHDWAIVEADTGTIPALEIASAAELKIGDRALTFNVEAGPTRGIGGIDITGKPADPQFGQRIGIAPALPPETAGMPVLTGMGAVAGIVGGSRTPGSRLPVLASRSRGLFSIAGLSEAVPASLLTVPPNSPGDTLGGILASGALTPPMTVAEELIYAGTTRDLSKDPRAGLGADTVDFSRRDSQVYIYALWQRRGKRGKGVVTGAVTDTSNRPFVKIQPSKVSFLNDTPTRTGISFAPTALRPGTYRVDLLLDDAVCWRGFIRIVD